MLQTQLQMTIEQVLPFHLLECIRSYRMDSSNTDGNDESDEHGGKNQKFEICLSSAALPFLTLSTSVTAFKHVMSERELALQGIPAQLDPSISLSVYINTSLMIFQQAESYLDDNELQWAKIWFMKYEIMIKLLQAHPQWSVPKYQVQHERLLRKLTIARNEISNDDDDIPV